MNSAVIYKVCPYSFRDIALLLWEYLQVNSTALIGIVPAPSITIYISTNF